MAAEDMTNSHSGDKRQAEDSLAAAIQALNLDPQSIQKVVGVADAMQRRSRIWLERWGCPSGSCFDRGRIGAGAGRKTSPRRS